MRRPLIVMSPKSLLRHPLAVSSLEELAEGVFHDVIDEIDDIKPAKVKRVVLCSGKVYYDLLETRRKNEQDDVAIIRIEQLYPFPHKEMDELVEKYQHVKDWVWCQEEPQNQGAWYPTQHRMRRVIKAINEKIYLRYAGRTSSAAPAAGYASVHVEEQTKLINQAFEIE